MPKKQPESPEPSVTPHIPATPRTPEEELESRQIDATADRLVQDWVKGLNEAVLKGKMSNY